ncbi:MAG: choice-of-anchor D domain-containing protein [Candidatus Kapabacteria bacterium]|nr:choice-of-anchor D domain-containing protein [Candidatus Kapabacteria bacterium]
MQTRIAFIIICILLFVGAGMHAIAQIERPLPSRKAAGLEGTEFIVGFMQNELRTILYPGGADVLRLYIASEFDARVRVRVGRFEEFFINVKADSVATVNVSDLYEVRFSSVVEGKGIQLSSDVPISVYLLNSRALSTDTYAAIPTTYLGKEYVIASLPAVRYDSTSDDEANLHFMRLRPGQFMVIGSAPNTKVRIVPSCNLVDGHVKGDTIEVFLNAGDTYLVQGDTTELLGNNLTGTRVTSTQPVVVLSGHVRTSVTTSALDLRSSKDHLVEQLLPTDRWGRRFAVVPFGFPDNTDKLLIVPNELPVKVTFHGGGIPITTDIVSPNALEWSISNAAYIETDKPVQLIQLMQSPTGRTGPVPLGDPAMVVVPPLEYYTNYAVFQAPRLLLDDVGTIQRTRISVISDLSAASSLRNKDRFVADVDPNFLNRRVPGTNLCFSVLDIDTAVVYKLEADSGQFSGVMYAVANADSYANIYGMSFEPSSRRPRTPPRFEIVANCGELSGLIRDSTTVDAMLDPLEVDIRRTFNIDYELGTPSTNGAVSFRARVVNRFRDARIVLQAYDTNVTGREWDYHYNAPELRFPPEIRLVAGSATVCEVVHIVNADTASVVIKGLSLTGDVRYSFSPALVKDTILRPGDTLTVTICLAPPTTPAPSPAVLVFVTDCNLEYSVNVRPITGASLQGVDVDLGVVRLGDQACGKARIQNDGVTPVTVTALDLSSTLPEFTVDLAALQLPRVLQPGQSMDVPVCVIPRTVGVVRRLDSVRSTPALRTAVGYTVRGIRPDVRNVSVNWPNLRVGTSEDGVATLANRGEADAVLTLARAVGDVEAFDISAFNAGPVRIDSLSSAVLRLRFNPTQRGTATATLHCVVDWEPHDTVTITLTGSGTLPEIVVTDVDFGKVIVGRTATRATTVYETSGNEALTIRSVALGGGDVAAFVIDPELYRLGVKPIGHTVAEEWAFTPSRLGPHETTILITHDAAPAFKDSVSIIRFRGLGVPEGTDTTDEIVASTVFLDVPSPRWFCNVDTASVRATVQGTVPRIARGLNVSVDGVSVESIGPRFPVQIVPGEELAWFVPLAPTRQMQTSVVAQFLWADGSDTTLTRIVPAEPIPIVVGKPKDVLVRPGVETRVVGSVSLPIAVSEPLRIRVRVQINRARFALDSQSSLVWIDAGGTKAPITAAITQTADFVEFVTDSKQTLPVVLGFDIAGLALLDDPRPLQVAMFVYVEDCIEQRMTDFTWSTELCGDIIRMVRIGGGLEIGLRSSVVGSGEDVLIDVLAEESGTVDVSLEDMSGKRMSLWEKLSLNMGHSVLKFHNSVQASGLYRLVVRHGNGDVLLPLILVK